MLCTACLGTASTVDGGAGSPGGGGGGENTGGGNGGGTAHTGGGAATAASLFEQPHPWTEDVSAWPVAPTSSAITSTVGNWGTKKFQIDFAFILLTADASTPKQQVIVDPAQKDYCFKGPDCETLPLQMPVPPNGNTEGSSTYACDTANNDCHVLVHDTSAKKLYELYLATGTANGLKTYGAFVWDLTKQYPASLRGESCTSADAAGLPIAALLVTADQVASGDIGHALRFILPNPSMKAGVYVHPATHAGAPSNPSPNAPPYGVRFRLKAGFDETPYNPAQKTVLHALKKYGMILSDGGNVPLTFSDDRLSSAKWAALGIDSHSFDPITPNDFEVVGLGPEFDKTQDCVRNP